MKIPLILILIVFFLSGAQPVAASTIKGRILFEGELPSRPLVRLSADPTCKLHHPNGLASDSILVSEDGGLQNVFVYIKEGLAGNSYPVPTEPVVLDQEGCVYKPRVFGLQVDQPLKVVNSDDTLHNVRTLARQNKRFNLGLPIKGMTKTKKFSNPEIMLTFKCDVHPWMRAYAGVLEHPFYAVSASDGSFSIFDLEPGTYMVEAWHEKLGVLTQTITLNESKDTQEITFRFKE